MAIRYSTRNTNKVNEIQKRCTLSIVVRRNQGYICSSRLTFWVPVSPISLLMGIRPYNRFDGSITPTNRLADSITPTNKFDDSIIPRNI